MRLRRKFLIASIFLSFFGAANASEPCTLSIKPETSGFFLNPILNKVVVVKALGAGCSLMVNDEILQLNDQVIPGERANTVMSYWKSLGKGMPRTFKVRRAGTIVIVSQ